MLPPFIIEQIRKREKEEREHQAEQPRLELPLERRRRPEASDEEKDRGVVIVDAYQLDDLRTFLAPIWSVDSSVRAASDICASVGLPPNATPILYPGPCGSLNLDAPPGAYFASSQGRPPIRNSARIGAFATDAVFVCHPPSDPTEGTADCSRGDADPRGARLFVPVRGDPSVTFFDVDDDRQGQ